MFAFNRMVSRAPNRSWRILVLYTHNNIQVYLVWRRCLCTSNALNWRHDTRWWHEHHNLQIHSFILKNTIFLSSSRRWCLPCYSVVSIDFSSSSSLLPSSSPFSLSFTTSFSVFALTSDKSSLICSSNGSSSHSVWAKSYMCRFRNPKLNIWYTIERRSLLYFRFLWR